MNDNISNTRPIPSVIALSSLLKSNKHIPIVNSIDVITPNVIVIVII